MNILHRVCRLGSISVSVVLPAVALLGSMAFASMNEDAAAIRQQAGCFQVDFKFDEIVEEGSNFLPRKNYKDNVIEWVVLDRDTAEEISLVHMLVINRGPFPIMKHWRQTWVHGGKSIIEYQGDYRWKKRDLKPEEMDSGSWIQKISRIDDGPNRECVGKWTHSDVASNWACSALSPIVRRDFGRSSSFDYIQHSHRYEFVGDVLHLGETLEKRRKTDSGHEVVVTEVGGGTYTRIDESQCEGAKTFWNSKKGAWQEVYLAWEKIFQDSNSIQLKYLAGNTVENVKTWKKLWSKLYRYAVPAEGRLSGMAHSWMETKTWGAFFGSLITGTPEVITQTPREIIEEDWVFSKDLLRAASE